MTTFLVPIDLNQNELQNAVVHNLPAPPLAPSLGQVYFDTVLGTERFWNGTAWISTDATLATGIPISALAVNPLDRANQTGTQLSTTISDFTPAVLAAVATTAARKVAATVGDGIGLTFVVTHNLGTRDVVVGAYNNTTFNDVVVGVQRTTINTVTVTFVSLPLLNAVRVVVMG